MNVESQTQVESGRRLATSLTALFLFFVTIAIGFLGYEFYTHAEDKKFCNSLFESIVKNDTNVSFNTMTLYFDRCENII